MAESLVKRKENITSAVYPVQDEEETIAMMQSVQKIKQHHYDKYDRYKESQKFYHSSAWKSAREMKLRQNPLCECCQQAGKTVKADMVHHMIPVKKGTNNLDLDYMVSLCHSCHNRIETEIERET